MAIDQYHRELARLHRTMSFTREALQKGKDQYGWPPCTYWFRSAAFQTETIFFCLYKTTYLDKEVNRTHHFPSVRLPCFRAHYLGEGALLQEGQGLFMLA